MIDPSILIVVVLMASVTYITRISGYLFLRGRTLRPRRAVC
jgi:uncharacterized membrane protein